MDASDPDLYQGQVLDKFDLLVPNYQKSPDRTESVTGRLTGKIVILSQTCDLVAKYITEPRSVLVAPATKLPPDTDPNGIGHIARARNHLYYPLSRDDDFGMEHMVVRLDAIATVPFSALAAFAKTRKSFRLGPPFAEHFGHFVGELFSRVALPDKALDIGEFTKAIVEKAAEAPTAFPGSSTRSPA